MDNRILKSILILTVIMPFVAFAEPNGCTGGYEYVETGHPSDTLSRTYYAAASLPYGEGEIFAWEDIEPSDEPSCGNAKSNERFFDSEIIKNAKFRAKRVASRATDEIAYKDITLSAPGTLASALGDEINEIDSLVVRGPINAADFHTIWSSSFYGGLTVANLEYAQIEGNKIPQNAFWNQSEQYTPGSEYVNCIPLRRIILPEGLVEIGEGAFCYAIKLENVNFSSTLRRIKKRCFSDCISLDVNPLVIPEGVEEIGTKAFVNCKSLTGKVILPTTLKKINDGSFFATKITECNFPEGLEEIGDAAFYATRLREVILPNSCQSLSGSDHFALNYELEKVRFPEGLTTIPVGFVDDCIELKEFIMPNSIEVIGDRAFWQCGNLQELKLSLKLKSIGLEGLYYCKGLYTIYLPSTLETLGAESCENWKNVKSIYCAAEIPPVCIDSEINPGWTPFGKYGEDFENRTPQDTPIYVPVGSADLYRNAWGWDYFTNFIEIDDFPLAGVDVVLVAPMVKETIIHDLYGRRIKSPVPGNIYIINGEKIFFK
ncbi:MAG: leucine-rich repeat domain-containing protein [Muribaculaceae bacterium]|nr:leucine-rich repeat domain-containing protein [Muribaculaceae bacterium]